MKKLLKKILITRPIFADQIAALRQHADVTVNESDVAMSPAELIMALQGMDGAVTTLTEKITPALLEACPSVKVIANIAVGYNNIDVAACHARGVIVTNTPDVLTETTADFGFALLMATARRLTEAEAFLRAGQWQRWGLDQLAGKDIHGATLGIVGMGRIGSAIARRAAGFGMQIIYHNRKEASGDTGGATYCESLPALLGMADFVMLVVPYTPATHHLMNAETIAMMKPDAMLINIARGGVVDDAALITALRNKTIAAAGLDVFEGEPALNPAFLELKNVVLTPHIASSSLATRRAMSQLAIDNCLDIVNGGAGLTVVSL